MAKYRVPLVLQQPLRAIPESKPKSGTYYCGKRQIWIQDDGRPVVAGARRGASDFGETTATATQEGVDQVEATSEGGIVSSSDFGETTITKTSEGTDQTENASFLASDFGETSLTRTSEGADQTEALSSSDFGETTKSATAEGIDQAEALDVPSLDPS